MNGNWRRSLRDRWVHTSVAAAACIAVVSFIVGFAWLPFKQPGEEFRGLWDAICSAAGLVQAPDRQPVVEAIYPTTQAELIPGMLRSASAESIGRGATLALRCTMCHGARGLSQANTPNLAGQPPSSIYKQLLDFKSGARASAIMAPLVADLSDRDIRDLAAYYAYLPRVYATGAPNEAAPRIVADGAPMR
ncbi:MAG TPA: c-type cytochrome, partial [Ktedonobacterales bacterium]|nr:c-type cytochrome [Ktedonobacterales bacterium]